MKKDNDTSQNLFLKKAIRKHVECQNPSGFVCIHFLHKLPSV